MPLRSFLRLAAGTIAILCYNPAAADCDPAQLQPRAQALVGQLAAGKGDEAVKDFSAEMQAALPPQRLAAVWQSLEFSVGKMKGFGEPEHVSQDTPKRVCLVRLPIKFERGELIAQVSFGEDGSIDGLYFLPGTATPTPVPLSNSSENAFAESECIVGEGTDWPLPATLTMPRGDGKFPGVVLVHGSGPQDRDESVGPNKPFRDLAHGLAAHGIAVLRYEKRTLVHQKKMAELTSTLTLNDETIDDAVLASEFLREDPRVADHRVFILGHSLGALAMPRIAARARNAAGFIMAAAPVTPMDELMVIQTEYIVSRDGTVDADEQAALDETKAAMARARALAGAAPGPDDKPVMGIGAAYWRDVLALDLKKEVVAIRKPLLILQGARDYQVRPDPEFKSLKEVLDGRENVTFRLYDQLNHLFIAGEGEPGPDEYKLPGHVDQRVIDDVAAFIVRH